MTNYNNYNNLFNGRTYVLKNQIITKNNIFINNNYEYKYDASIIFENITNKNNKNINTNITEFIEFMNKINYLIKKMVLK